MERTIIKQQILRRKGELKIKTETLIEMPERKQSLEDKRIYLKNHNSIHEEDLGKVEVNTQMARVVSVNPSKKDIKNNEKKLIESLINYTKDFIVESDRKREELVKQIDILKEMSVSGGKKWKKESW